jgi:hypothetical protein
MVKIRPGTVEETALLWKAEVETARTAGRLGSRPDELLLGSGTRRAGTYASTGATCPRS